MPTPNGSPAWVRANNHTTYGGDLNKRNFQGQGAVDAQTDVTAEEIARIAADLEALQRVCPFATLTYRTNDAAPAAPTIERYDAMAGAAPTATRNGNGDVQFDWATSYLDPYGVSGAVHIAHAEATVHGSAAAISVVVLSDPNGDTRNERVRVRVFSDAGVALLDVRVTLTVTTSTVA